jgi:hypothetical protein
VLSDNSLAERKSSIKSFVKEVRVTGDEAHRRGDASSVYYKLWWAIMDLKHRLRSYQDRGKPLNTTTNISH